MNKNEENTKNQRTSLPVASNEKVNGDMAKEWEELVELDDVQLATIVGGGRNYCRAVWTVEGVIGARG